MMMTTKEVMTTLESYGDPAIKKIYLNHGVKEPLFGVRVADMKKIVKKVKKNHELSLELYKTKNNDAMYLAGLIADEKRIRKADLQYWVKNARNNGISEYTVPWVAAESPFGYELGLEWIQSPKESVATSGWVVLSYHASLRPDEELDIKKYNELLEHVGATIHEAPNRVRYVMNGFVIAIGSYITELSEKAMYIAHSIGKVRVNVGNTACKVPFAPDYINKVIDKGNLGKKRKKARC